MALQAIVNRNGVYKVVLQERAEGVYVFSFPGADHTFSLRDDLQDDWEMAKRCSAQRYGTTEGMWQEIPETDLMAR